MNINNLFFHINYCNMRQADEPWKYKAKLTRTLDHHELLLATGGKGSVVIANRRYNAQAGDIFYIPEHTMQSIESDFNDPLYFISVHFCYANVFFSDNNWSVKSEARELPLSSIKKVENIYQINHLFWRLVSGWYAKLPGYEFSSKALLQQLIFELYTNEKVENRNYSVELKIESVIKYMHENIDKKLTLSQLADMVNLSPTYLSRAFKERTGYSIIYFFNKLKIDKSKELIIDGDRKIKEVAKELGFGDEFYFSRLFKKIEGVSPLDFYSNNVHEF
ncbi:AraC family transcriptional regulator [Clostridium manihotivorum]|uniref:AraC family transcriptional regulator n=1 Tax=Clostridium manihotivorum TaxID=2320868 RepID=A0A3R5UID6_9CLOT|nr:AraC family transcriptional regulator [Clostridium manihotivorum]QAA34524.1 AraC family transcriptional regulator [Clostridium manihotivorum]